MEREENTIYHSEQLHMAQKWPLHSSITAGDFICHGAHVMALRPQTGCTDYKQNIKLLSRARDQEFIFNLF